MAGEWIKFEASTPDKPEVLAITVEMGWDDPDLTVGKLLRVWRWFDQQTIDGNAPGVTQALLDRLIGVSGLCAAMESVGWLESYEGGVRLPNFERHNGKTAKNRALTAKRVAKHKTNAKGNAKGNDDSVTSALPREEKRREEVNITTLPGNPGQSQSPTSSTAKPSEAFMRWWNVWPNTARKADRKKCWEKWRAKRYDEVADQIVAHVEFCKRMNQQWRDGFEPAPLTYLNGERWNDGVVPTQPQERPRSLVL